ncbi:MAG: glutamine--fructose-6-phosphate transaminase (isomerizing) [Chloroflexi bacterium]|nr:glutamine--fructose-6-phosphate transaminase (isomerizing) [Chloroflexota bacterium]
MCGIIGYTGNRAATQIILDGLTSLEYRGYDSAGIAVIDSAGEPSIHKAAGKLENLKKILENGHPEGTSGIGHTRWATHGGPTDFNAHPHTDCGGDVMVVHNGIVENYLDLKRELIAGGHQFSSQTDAECIPHLIESFILEEYSLEDAVRATANRMSGANAVVVMSKSEPGKIVSFKLGNAGGIVVGYGKDEMLLASDLPALLPHTRDIVYLAGGEMVTVTRDNASYHQLDGTATEKTPMHVSYDALTSAKGEYKHFMLKEIHEQPEVAIDALRGRVSFDDMSIDLEDFPFSDEEVRNFDRVILVGMGTSLHAAMVGRLWIESLARIPAESDNSSEFRYRDPVLSENTLVISISQSGETADTLAAMDEAKRKGVRQLTLCNYAGTQTTRVADGTILLRAGLEIGVASSKTFTCSLISLYMLALYMGVKRGTVNKDQLEAHVRDLARLPDMLGRLLSEERQYETLAQRWYSRSDFLFLGRGINYPLAMEGALKLKELSYIHAEGYPAGEMKHGPISLIDEEMPVVALMPKDSLYEKMLSNVNEVKARGGIVIAIATEGDESIRERADDVIYLPEASPDMYPILNVIPAQLIAYHIAVRRGCDVDQPRNLAKSVTVE